MYWLDLHYWICKYCDHAKSSHNLFTQSCNLLNVHMSDSWSKYEQVQRVTKTVIATDNRACCQISSLSCKIKVKWCFALNSQNLKESSCNFFSVQLPYAGSKDKQSIKSNLFQCFSINPLTYIINVEPLEYWDEPLWVCCNELGKSIMFILFVCLLSFISLFCQQIFTTRNYELFVFGDILQS